MCICVRVSVLDSRCWHVSGCAVVMRDHIITAEKNKRQQTNKHTGCGRSASPPRNYSPESRVRSSKMDEGRQKQKRSRTHNNLHYLRVTHEDIELFRVARRYLANQSTWGELRLLYGEFTRSGQDHECCRPHAHYCVLRLWYALLLFFTPSLPPPTPTPQPPPPFIFLFCCFHESWKINPSEGRWKCFLPHRTI